MFRRILVGFDGSPAATQAVGTAIALAGRLGGEVDVVAVVPTGTSEADAARLRVAAEASQQEAALEGVAFTVDVVEGARPAGVLAAHCAERGFDLVVVGRHGQDGSSESRVGPVAHQLVERSRTPVLVVGDDTGDP